MLLIHGRCIGSLLLLLVMYRLPQRQCHVLFGWPVRRLQGSLTQTTSYRTTTTPIHLSPRLRQQSIACKLSLIRLVIMHGHALTLYRAIEPHSLSRMRLPIFAHWLGVFANNLGGPAAAAALTCREWVGLARCRVWRTERVADVVVAAVALVIDD